MILLIAWLAAIVTVVLAYIIAGPIWVKRHSLWFNVGKQRRRVSGMYGEIAIVSFAAGMVWLIDSAGKDVSLGGLMADHPAFTLGAAIVVGLVVYVHGIRTAFAAEPDERWRLFFTYLVYGIYSLTVFAIGAVVVALLVTQAISDTQTLSGLADKAIGGLPAGIAGSDADLIRSIEFSYVDMQSLLSEAEDTMTPVFMFMAGIFAINLSIRLTPLRSLFINNAVLLTMISTLIGLLAVVAVGTWTYVGNYSAVISQYVDALEDLRGQAETMRPFYVMRYSEILVEMLDQKSLLSFVSRISSQWGGVAAGLGLAQWIAQQFNRPEAEESPGEIAPAGGH
ncbi:hypothetical protein [uncultured Hyphomonas sp.]|uniref:hypothetical protein n=1 Tax=uncultured Hyphomonas sp. TaxID=225298 RepID=UPI002AAAD6B3|nr:hypothetical protein [uncultured Hyphomonas sp.]